MVTDRAPGLTSGYGIRVTNVINGLASLGELHVCLVDGSDDGEELEGSDLFTASTVRATPPRRWERLRFVAGRAPSSVRYRDQADVRASITNSLGHVAWDLLWCSRVRTHLVTAGVRTGKRIVDFDDLGDRIALTAIRDRTGRHGHLATAPRNVLDLADALRWRRLQQGIARAVDSVVVCSELDRQRLAVPNCTIVPNGYPTPDPKERVDGPPTLLFVGPLTYEPNRLAVEWLAREVLPAVRRSVPTAQLIVAGDRSGVAIRGERSPGVCLVGMVPDVAPLYARATVAVTPLHSGGGTRLKVIEALARGVPLVSTTFGCEGIGLVPGEEVSVADEASDFAAKCVALIRDPAARTRLAGAGAARFARDLTADAASAAVRIVALDAIRPGQARSAP